MSRRYRALALLPTVLLLVAPAPAYAAGGLLPILDCVSYDAGTETLTARFGYANTNAAPVYVALGPNNIFTPDPLFRPGQPTSFLSGVFHDVFSISFPAATPTTWTLSGSSVTASNDPSTYCAGSGGPLSADSSLAMAPGLATTVGADVTVTSTVTDPLAPSTGTDPFGAVVYTLSDGLVAGPLPSSSPCVADSPTRLTCPVGPGTDNAVTVGAGTPGRYQVTGTFVASGEGDPRATDNVAATTVVVTGPPVATTGPGGSESTTGAVLTGIVDPAGTATSYSFAYWPEGHPEQEVTTTPGAAGDGFLPVPVEAALTGLRPATTYAYTVTAANAQGTDTGEPGTFTTTTPMSGLSVTATASPTAVPVGANVPQTFTVANGGPADATGVRLTVQLGDGAAFVSASPAAGSCTTSGSPVTVVCDLGTIGNGDDVAVPLVTTATKAGTLVTTGFVAGSEPDPSVADNLATSTVPVSAAAVGPADLSVTITSAAFGKVGSPLPFTVTVRNAGPGPADAVRLWLAPASSTVTSVTTTQGTCTPGATPGCALGSIPAGGSVRVTVQLTPTPVGPFTLTGTVGAAAPDPAPRDNETTRVVLVRK